MAQRRTRCSAWSRWRVDADQSIGEEGHAVGEWLASIRRRRPVFHFGRAKDARHQRLLMIEGQDKES